MIARAMNTGSADCLPFRELAGREARISRSISLREFSRIWSLVEAEASSATDTDVHVELGFHIDPEGFPWVSGSAEVPVELLCHRCAETVGHNLRAAFELCIVSDEVSAEQFAEARDVLVCPGSSLSVAEVVEDELLLALPERLCQTEPCDRMPQLDYPDQAVDAAASGNVPVVNESLERDNPFAALESLRRDLKKED